MIYNVIVVCAAFLRITTPETCVGMYDHDYVGGGASILVNGYMYASMGSAFTS